MYFSSQTPDRNCSAVLNNYSRICEFDLEFSTFPVYLAQLNMEVPATSSISRANSGCLCSVRLSYSEVVGGNIWQKDSASAFDDHIFELGD